jgi:hypothetical protein
MSETKGQKNESADATQQASSAVVSVIEEWDENNIVRVEALIAVGAVLERCCPSSLDVSQLGRLREIAEPLSDFPIDKVGWTRLRMYSISAVIQPDPDAAKREREDIRRLWRAVEWCRTIFADPVIDQNGLAAQ